MSSKAPTKLMPNYNGLKAEAIKQNNRILTELDDKDIFDKLERGLMEEVKNSVDGGGMRFNEDKTRLELLPPLPLEDIADVLAAGAKKYADHNWMRGMDWSKVIGCAERHLSKLKRGLDFDAGETDCFHAAQVAINMIFLLQYYRTCPDLDDRVKMMTSKEQGENAALYDKKVEPMNLTFKEE